MDMLWIIGLGGQPHEMVRSTTYPMYMYTHFSRCITVTLEIYHVVQPMYRGEETYGKGGARSHGTRAVVCLSYSPVFLCFKTG